MPNPFHPCPNCPTLPCQSSLVQFVICQRGSPWWTPFGAERIGASLHHRMRPQAPPPSPLQISLYRLYRLYRLSKPVLNRTALKKSTKRNQINQVCTGWRVAYRQHICQIDVLCKRCSHSKGSGLRRIIINTIQTETGLVSISQHPIYCFQFVTFLRSSVKRGSISTKTERRGLLIQQSCRSAEFSSPEST